MWDRILSLSAAAITVAVLSATVADAQAQTRPIDAEHSTLTVFAYKSGLFSAFADNHIVRAPVAGGSIAEEGPLSITLTIRSADLQVLDPGLAPERRSEVQS